MLGRICKVLWNKGTWAQNPKAISRNQNVPLNLPPLPLSLGTRKKTPGTPCGCIAKVRFLLWDQNYKRGYGPLLNHFLQIPNAMEYRKDWTYLGWNNQ